MVNRMSSFLPKGGHLPNFERIILSSVDHLTRVAAASVLCHSLSMLKIALPSLYHGKEQQVPFHCEKNVPKGTTSTCIIVPCKALNTI